MRRAADGTSLFIALCLSILLLHPAMVWGASCGAGLNTSDFSFRGVDSDACAGPLAGNPNSLGEFNGPLAAASGVEGGWEVLLSPNPGTEMSADWNGFRFSFLPEPVLGPSPASGNYWLTVQDLVQGVPPEFPIRVDLLLAPRVGGLWAGYVFDDEEFTLDETGYGAWRITFGHSSSPQGPAMGMTHMSLLLRDFVGSGCELGCEGPLDPMTPPTGPTETTPPGGPSTSCDGPCGPTTQSVPEPSTLASLLLALAVVAGMRRRRR